MSSDEPVINYNKKLAAFGKLHGQVCYIHVLHVFCIDILYTLITYISLHTYVGYIPVSHMYFYTCIACVEYRIYNCIAYVKHVYYRCSTQMYELYM